MKKPIKKTQFNITLHGWDAAVLEEALAIEVKASEGGLLHPGGSKRELQLRRSRLIRLALGAVCAAIIKSGKLPPFGVELRPEDSGLQKLRVEYIDGPTGLSVSDKGDDEDRGFGRSGGRWFAC